MTSNRWFDRREGGALRVLKGTFMNSAIRLLRHHGVGFPS
jgi:hypothetical protein